MDRRELVRRAAFGCIVVGLAASACGRNATPDSDAAAAAATAKNSPPPVAFRVCSDPNNLPFSNDRAEGFENMLADIVAADLGLPIEYTWWAQRRGFIRNTLNAGRCDIVMGMPVHSEMVLTTQPYYTSTYVVVARRGAAPFVSLDDPRLKTATIGVHLAGDDYGNPPPAHALARRGIIENVRGFRLTDDYSLPNPTARIVEAVAAREIDVAIVWGPIGGYFAARQSPPLTVHRLEGDESSPAMPFTFSIAAAVRRDDERLQSDVDRVLERRRSDIQALLARFHVPAALSAETFTPSNGHR